MSDYRDAIDGIMDNFDFERVHKVMLATNWLWHRHGGNFDDYYQPEPADLRVYARNQLKSCVEEMIDRDLEEFAVECGGFRSHAWRDRESGEIDLQLQFIVESWDTFE